MYTLVSFLTACREREGQARSSLGRCVHFGFQTACRERGFWEMMRAKESAKDCGFQTKLYTLVSKQERGRGLWFPKGCREGISGKIKCQGALQKNKRKCQGAQSRQSAKGRSPALQQA